MSAEPASRWRPLAFSSAAALVCHLLEVVWTLRVDNALLAALPDGERARWLLGVVAAFPVTAVAGWLVALPWARSRPRAAAAVAAGVAAAIPAVEALRHLDDVRGTALLVFGLTAVAVSLIGAGAAWSRRPGPVGRRHAAPPAVLLAALAVLLVFRPRADEPVAVAAAPLAEEPDAAVAPPPPAQNLLVLLVDTLRADHLGCYGYARDTSPHLDAFARDGVLFERAATPKPKTSPAVASLFTGTWPQTHRVQRTSTVLPPEQVTLAELLAEQGFATGAVAANVNISELYGFSQGFDHFVSVKRIKEPGRKVEKHAGRVADAFIDWLERRGDERWFGYVHFIDPHSPYRPPKGYRERFEGDELDGKFGVRDDLDMLEDDYIDGIHRAVWLDAEKTDLDGYVSRYDGEIAFTDEGIRRVLDALERTGHADDTVIVFTADHGESIDEHHCYFNHGLFPYEEQVHVPLVFRGPGACGADASTGGRAR